MKRTRIAIPVFAIAFTCAAAAQAEVNLRKLGTALDVVTTVWDGMSWVDRQLNPPFPCSGNHAPICAPKTLPVAITNECDEGILLHLEAVFSGKELWVELAGSESGLYSLETGIARYSEAHILTPEFELFAMSLGPKQIVWSADDDASKQDYRIERFFEQRTNPVMFTLPLKYQPAYAAGTAHYPIRISC